MKPLNDKEILEEKEENEENLIEYKISKKGDKFNLKALFILIDIISLILTAILGILKYMIAFIIFLVITIIISLSLLVIFIFENKRYNKNGDIFLKQEEEEVEEERKRKKKEIIDRQFALKKSDEEKIRTENVTKVLEDMCAFGSIMKEEILEEKKKEPEKFISIEEAIEEKDKDNGIFCLGVLAQNLEQMGITTAIEKKAPNDIDSINASNTVLQFITNGMIEKPKYDLHFDLGDERNNELLNNKDEQEKFNNKLRKKLSIEYNIPEDQIIITNAQRGSYRVQAIFQIEQFNKTININEFKSKCSTDDEFKELQNLKEVHKGLIMEGCKLNSNFLDARGNREKGWGENEKRGGFPYNPPKGWKGYGLKVMDVYDDGNNDWLAYDGNPKEWAIAYHGIGCKLGSTVENATKEIFHKGFIAGRGQAYESYKNDNPIYKCDDKQNDHSQLIGKGVYCSPDPSVMEQYARLPSTKANANGKNYLMGFMMRVKPDKIRYSNSKDNYWVLNGTKDEMRPYRIMIKEC